MTIIAVPFFMGQTMSGFEVPEPHVLLDPRMTGESPQERMALLYRMLADVVASDRAEERPVVYAGDCVASIGVVAGLQRRGVDLTLVWFDAHGDFNTWETTPSGFLGGMPLAMVTGRGEQSIVDGAGAGGLDDRRVWLVGARDLDPGERELVAESGMTKLTVEQALETPVPTGPLYIHIDVDVVDPEDMPAVNYPAPGGPRLDTVARAVEHLATGNVVAVSISSWNPELDLASEASAATRALLAPFL